MDHQTFDRLTRLVGTAASRRTAWRALLGLALSGGVGTVARERAWAAPNGPRAESCADGSTCRGDACCGRECCPGRCFVTREDDKGTPIEWKCCRPPVGVMCEDETARGGVVCCPYNREATEEQACSCVGSGGIAGSYRRR